jgi:hypothetical protein
MRVPSWYNYGQYSTTNYGAHSLAFSDPEGNTFFYSYKTLVAFQPVGDRMYVSRNQWSKTTGRHLNWIDGGDKKNRLDMLDFQRAFDAAFPV